MEPQSSHHQSHGRTNRLARGTTCHETNQVSSNQPYLEYVRRLAEKYESAKKELIRSVTFPPRIVSNESPERSSAFYERLQPRVTYFTALKDDHSTNGRKNLSRTDTFIQPTQEQSTSRCDRPPLTELNNFSSASQSTCQDANHKNDFLLAYPSRRSMLRQESHHGSQTTVYRNNKPTSCNSKESSSHVQMCPVKTSEKSSSWSENTDIEAKFKENAKLNDTLDRANALLQRIKNIESRVESREQRSCDRKLRQSGEAKIFTNTDESAEILEGLDSRQVDRTETYLYGSDNEEREETTNSASTNRSEREKMRELEKLYLARIERDKKSSSNEREENKENRMDSSFCSCGASSARTSRETRKTSTNNKSSEDYMEEYLKNKCNFEGRHANRSRFHEMRSRMDFWRNNIRHPREIFSRRRARVPTPRSMVHTACNPTRFASLDPNFDPHGFTIQLLRLAVLLYAPTLMPALNSLIARQDTQIPISASSFEGPSDLLTHIFRLLVDQHNVPNLPSVSIRERPFANEASNRRPTNWPNAQRNLRENFQREVEETVPLLSAQNSPSTSARANESFEVLEESEEQSENLQMENRRSKSNNCDVNAVKETASSLLSKKKR